MGAKGFSLPAKLSNTKIILNGGQRVSFIRPDGYFSLYPVLRKNFIVFLNGSSLFASTIYRLTIPSDVH